MGNSSVYTAKRSRSNSTAAANCPANVNLSFALAITVSNTSYPIYCKFGAPPRRGASGLNCAQIEGTESLTFEIKLTTCSTILWVCTTSMLLLLSCAKSVYTRDIQFFVPHHSAAALCVSEWDCIKFWRYSNSIKAFQQEILILIHCTDCTTMKVPACLRCPWLPPCYNAVQSGSSLWGTWKKEEKPLMSEKKPRTGVIEETACCINKFSWCV